MPAQTIAGAIAWFITLAAATLLVAEPERQAKDLEPSPQLSPEEVARFQVGSLAADGDLQDRIDRCYRFASPANRFHTGPPKQFAVMIQSEPYTSLLNPRRFLVGRAVIEDGEAYLLLTLVDSKGELRMFRWFLSKQSNVQYDGCWMTDAVVPVGSIKPPMPMREPPALPTI